jgi:hypothetical protein
MVFRRIWKKIKREEEDVGKRNNTYDTESSPNKDESENSGSKNFQFEMDDLVKTHFPDFEHIPEEDFSDDESDYGIDQSTRTQESYYEEKVEKYKTKQDQDVAVFLALADRMSMSSLLHLLQGHVRAENLDIQHYSDIARVERERSRKRPSIFASPKKKLFRWAEVTNGQVRAAVKEVENFKSMKNLWWKAAEMRTIQYELVETVQFFRRYRHDYIESVEVIAQQASQLPENVVEGHMKNLTKDCYTRGLEAHIVKLLSNNRKKTVRAVMEEQFECTDDEYDVKSHCLREQSLAYSKLSRTFAQKMGQCDEIIALKANLCAW